MGLDRQKAAGPRMLEWANRLAAVAYLVDTDVGGDPIFTPEGPPSFILDADSKPQLDPASPGADAVLQKFVDNIDTFRQLTALFEQPLGEWDLPEP